MSAFAPVAAAVLPHIVCFRARWLTSEGTPCLPALPGRPEQGCVLEVARVRAVGYRCGVVIGRALEETLRQIGRAVAGAA